MPNGLIATHSGKLVNPLDLKPEDVDIHDIAHALSNICRYGGHVRKFYSVAQHSIIMLDLLKGVSARPDEQLLGLLHDAEEAYLMDFPNPIKQLKTFGEYREFCERASKAIYNAFEIPWPVSIDRIKRFDQELVTLEARQLMQVAPEWEDELARFEPGFPRFSILPWDPHVARHHFLRAFEDVQKLRG